MGSQFLTNQANGIPLDTAAIVSTVLEGIVYGISIMMFIGTIWALTYRRTPVCINTGLILVACLMLLLSTAHMVLDIIRTYQGLVGYRDTFQPGGPIGFFSDISQWSFVYKNLIYMLQTLVGDGVVIYRCYVLWQSWWIIIFPMMLWASLGVTGFGSVYFDSQATVYKENVFVPTTARWITSFLADAFFTNLFVTSLLAFRIWKLGRHVTGTSRSTVLLPILRIILDAGVLYSVSLLAMLVCFVAKNRGNYVMIDVSVPIISITFYMVIIRTTLSVSQDTARPSSTGSSRFSFPRRMSRYNRASEHRTKRMEVHISRLTASSEHEELPVSRQNGDPQKEWEMVGFAV